MPMSHSSEVQDSRSGLGKAGLITKADKKHDIRRYRAVAKVKLRTYVYNSFTYKHIHLPQVTDTQLPWQDSSLSTSSFVFHGTARI